MKILWVKSGKLLPLDTGGKLRTYNILRHLSANHDLTYISYYGGQRDEAYEREILSHLPVTLPVFTPPHCPVPAQRGNGPLEETGRIRIEMARSHVLKD